MSDLIDFKCPACGGSMEFEPNAQNMKCPYCDTIIDIDKFNEAYEQVNTQKFEEDGENYKVKEKSDGIWDTTMGGEWDTEDKNNMSVYSCQSCGGEVITENTVGATTCPYCGNNVVISGQFLGKFKPNYIIPFQIDKQRAKQALNKHIQGKKFLPKVFKDQNHIEKIEGVYVPFWLFNCNADANIAYEAQKIRTWSDSEYNYRETTNYMVSREGNIEFEKIPVDGLTRMPNDLMESIEPFEFESAVKFQTGYLAGYLAEKYDVDAQECIDRVNSRVEESVEDAFRNTVVGYDRVSVRNSNVKVDSGEIDYVLYPVWILHTNWNKKQYTFAMNGQTGKFVGDLPMDKNAYIMWILTVGMILSGVICGIMALIFFVF